MEPAVQSLIDRLDRLSDEFQELRDGVQKAIQIAVADPEMALIRARKVLEYVVRDVFERRVKEPPGTRPLEGLIERLVKDGHLPPRLAAYTETIRELGNVGAHRFGQKITAADVYRSLDALLPVLEWYFEEEHPGSTGDGPTTSWQAAERIVPAEPTRSRSDQPSLPVVPKGLRSFDADDSNFFLQLLPGARDKDGLPESIRFWKYRIEATAELTFTVGVIYGPSGCGKSSLVKAGLLPRLSRDIIAVYVEATPGETETKLLNGLRKRIPSLPGNLDLTSTIAALRQGHGLGGSRKVLLVLDQFEQWLHARRQEQGSELAQALRQCDGEHVQCVVMVRDDFWLALTRFLGELDIRLVGGENAALLDLFDPIHARSVLALFGQAYQHLPESLSDSTKEQNTFLDQAVTELSQDGRIISVRLALFADMVKGKRWTAATLKDVGGAHGVGVTFLEETFSAATAPPEHRFHQKGVQAVLKALLPETGTDIKGQMRSLAELRDASGYAGRPRDFADLIRILDPELRLITPTDPEGEGVTAPAQPARPAGERYYQLTHDYLVQSLRHWLTRKQRETWRGRAELKLAERAALWNASSEDRHLPSSPEWATIRLLTRKKDWSEPQRRMMKRAGRLHGMRMLGLAALLFVLSWGGIEVYSSLRAAALVDSLATAETSDVPGLVDHLGRYRRWANPLLVRLARESTDDSKVHLHASLALLPDEGQVEFLSRRLLSASPAELPVIWELLRQSQHAPVNRLWGVLEDPKADPDQRFRAACALALSDTGRDTRRWDTVSRDVADRLLATVLNNPSHYDPLITSLRDVRQRLIAPLSETFRDPSNKESERALATSILADYAGDQPGVLAGLLVDAAPEPFAILFPKVQAQAAQARVALKAELSKTTDADADQENRLQRQARATVALLRLGQAEDVWPRLRHSPDPRVRSDIIHWLKLLGTDPKVLIVRLKSLAHAPAPPPVEERSRMEAILFDPVTSVRRALILALGEYQDLPAAARKPLVATLLTRYRNDPDAGIHGAAEWTLRQWQQDEELKKAAAGLPRLEDRGDRRWYVNSAGQTLALIEGPVVFSMGSSSSDPDHLDSETLHRKRINRRFAIATKEVTVDQYQRFLKENPKVFQLGIDKYSPEPGGPMNGPTWYEAAAYCNWLSRQEKLEECYAPNSAGEYAAGMKCAADFLDRPGYRLPTEAEWEYACRAGAATSRYFGGSAALLEQYAWYNQNSRERAWPGGRLQPNELGLFDMLGNVYEWCQDQHGPYPTDGNEKISDDISNSQFLNDRNSRLLRGGAFDLPSANVRSALRNWGAPSIRNINLGFRLARTLPLIHFS